MAKSYRYTPKNTQHSSILAQVGSLQHDGTFICYLTDDEKSRLDWVLSGERRDRTSTQRTRRLTSKQNELAKRLGFDSWSNFGTVLRNAESVERFDHEDHIIIVVNQRS